jgi:hypothetical protein
MASRLRSASSYVVAHPDGNLTATFLTIKSILPGMKERRGGSIEAAWITGIVLDVAGGAVMA